MSKKVTVYTSDNCAYCPMVKKYLQMKGQDYDEINIATNPVEQKKMIELSGQMRVPVTIVTDDSGAKDVTVGYNVAKLASALA